jgi:hypothetical protein
MSKWTNTSERDPEGTDNRYYLKIYAAFSLGFGLFALGRGVIITFSQV